MRKALGRGLEALLPGGPAETTAPTRDRVPVAEIRPNPDQPRRHFDEAALESLAASIRARGLLQPLVVRRTAAGYELIAGERRLRPAQRAGLDSVPVVVRDAGPQERLELALIENVQRENLTALEEAEGTVTRSTCMASQDEVAQPSAGAGRRWLTPCDYWRSRRRQAQLEGGELSAGHACRPVGRKRHAQVGSRRRSSPIA
jgi:ParB family chromosome partitioning protein